MSFKALIYKVGINAVVDVPKTVTSKMKPVKGYIPVTGKINGHPFKQTLTSLKDGNFRLYVNIPMLKGSRSAIGDTASFTLRQDKSDRTKDHPMVPALKKELTARKLLPAFNALTESRKKEILRYLGRLKSSDTLTRNINKVIRQLEGKTNDVRVP
jgi:hypothetical protein